MREVFRVLSVILHYISDFIRVFFTLHDNHCKCKGKENEINDSSEREVKENDTESNRVLESSRAEKK